MAARQKSTHSYRSRRSIPCRITFPEESKTTRNVNPGERPPRTLKNLTSEISRFVSPFDCVTLYSGNRANHKYVCASGKSRIRASNSGDAVSSNTWTSFVAGCNKSSCICSTALSVKISPSHRQTDGAIGKAARERTSSFPSVANVCTRFNATSCAAVQAIRIRDPSDEPNARPRRAPQFCTTACNRRDKKQAGNQKARNDHNDRRKTRVLRRAHPINRHRQHCEERPHARRSFQPHSLLAQNPTRHLR